MRGDLHQAEFAGRQVMWRHWPRPGGRPVLALHCALSHGAEWSGLAGSRPELAIHAPDLAGHGRMPEWDGRTDLHGESTALARALAGRIGGGGPVDVIGHSLGGTVALRLALESPGLTRRLVLVEPVLFAAARASAAWAPFVDKHREVETLVARGETQAALRAFLSVWGAGDDPAGLPPQLATYMQARIRLVMAIDEVLARDSAGLLRPAGLEGLTGPVLLIEGGESPPIIAALMAELAARLPRARRAVIPGAGHMLPVTHGAELSALVRDFLGQGA